jgi:hypothetical protein
LIRAPIRLPAERIPSAIINISGFTLKNYHRKLRGEIITGNYQLLKIITGKCGKLSQSAKGQPSRPLPF